MALIRSSCVLGEPIGHISFAQLRVPRKPLLGRIFPHYMYKPACVHLKRSSPIVVRVLITKKSNCEKQSSSLIVKPFQKEQHKFGRDRFSFSDKLKWCWPLLSVAPLIAQSQCEEGKEKLAGSRDLRKRVTIKIWTPNKDFHDKWGHIALETDKIYFSFRPNLITPTWPTLKDDIKATGRQPDETFDFFGLDVDAINTFCEAILSSEDMHKTLHSPAKKEEREEVQDLCIYGFPCVLAHYLKLRRNTLEDADKAVQVHCSTEDGSRNIDHVMKKRFLNLFYKALEKGNFQKLQPLPFPKKRVDGWLCPDRDAIHTIFQFTCTGCTKEFFAKAEAKEREVYKQ